MQTPSSSFSRRHFIRSGSAGLFAPAIFTVAGSLRAQQKADSNETLRLGLIGCGGRGSGAANQALAADYNTRLVAVADIDGLQIDRSLKNLSDKFPDRVSVDEDKRFTGLDAYQKLLASGVDVVILATPPGFRPMHLTAAVESGKHIFCEKPMAVDAAGYRVALEAVRKSKEKGISLVAGFCWRYAPSRVEAFKRLMDGEIGDVVASSHTYHTGPVKPMPAAETRPPGMGDVEWQIRNWYNFSWLSGDGLVEQAVHSVDKLCWAMKDLPPIHAVANGGRAIKANGGNIFDHFSVSYEFANNVVCHLDSKQIPSCHSETIDIICGTKGKLMIGKVGGGDPVIEGDTKWRARGKGEKDMYQVEHDEFFASIRAGKVINDGDRMLNSTMVAIMGRMASYTGKKVTWEDAVKSPEDLAPEESLKWGDAFEATPLPMPGVTKLV